MSVTKWHCLQSQDDILLQTTRNAFRHTFKYDKVLNNTTTTTHQVERLLRSFTKTAREVSHQHRKTRQHSPFFITKSLALLLQSQPINLDRIVKLAPPESITIESLSHHQTNLCNADTFLQNKSVARHSCCTRIFNNQVVGLDLRSTGLGSCTIPIPTSSPRFSSNEHFRCLRPPSRPRTTDDFMSHLLFS